MSVYTKIYPQQIPELKAEPSPTLIYRKWQSYDSFSSSGELEVKKSRLEFLKQVADYVRIGNPKPRYAEWLKIYLEGIAHLGAVNTDKSYTTVWRLIVGWSSNPSLETGIHLHHLYGFPIIPGSTVKGLTHHVAEMTLIDGSWEPPTLENMENVENFNIQSLDKTLHQAELIRILFGSLFVKRHWSDSLSGKESGLDVPLEWLKKWAEILKGQEEHKELFRRITSLTNEETTGGMLTFFDAVPTPEALSGENILQTDILNPHYPDYYQDKKNEVYPSDDQSPNPVYFLAVRPRISFIFPFKIQKWPQTLEKDDQRRDWIDILNEYSPSHIKDMVVKWLKIGLQDWGVGAKTSAGYGYFDVQ